MGRTLSDISDDLYHATRINDVGAVRSFIEGARTTTSESASALISFAEGYVAFRTGEFSNAIQHLSQALEASIIADDKVAQARVHMMFTRLYRSTGEHQQVFEHCNRALALNEELSLPVEIAQCYMTLARASLNRGNTAEALAHNERAIALLTDSNDEVGLASAAHAASDIYSSVGDYSRALENLYTALSHYTSVGDRHSEASILAAIGAIHDLLGDHAVVPSFYERAQAIYTEFNDQSSLAHMLGNLAIHYHNIGDFDGFESRTRQAIRLAEDLNMKREHAYYATNLFVALVNDGRYDDARVVVETHRPIMDLYPTTAASTKGSLGIMYSGLGDLVLAKELMEESLQMAMATGSREQIADCHMDLRELCKKSGDFDGYVHHNEMYSKIHEEVLGAEQHRKLAMQIKQREMDIQRLEHEKHISVLHSTLPKHVADRVARGEAVNDHYDSAAVLFLDIVGFTTLSSTLSSQQVSALLDTLFGICDAACTNNQVTRIKTIGDSYLAFAS